MQSELKPCPFCGGAPEGKYGSRADINCTSCPAGVSVSLHPGIFTTYEGQRKAEEARAIEAWNRRAALSDKQAGEVKAQDIIDRSHTIVDDVLDMALYLRDCPRENIWKYQDAANRLAAFMNEVRSALVDVPAVEPVAWRWESAYGGEDLIGQWQVSTVEPSRSEDATDFICEPLYASPPIPREGEDSAEVVTLTRAAADRIAQRLEFDASWDKCGDGYYSIKRQLAALAATRSGSATTQK